MNSGCEFRVLDMDYGILEALGSPWTQRNASSCFWNRLCADGQNIANDVPLDTILRLNRCKLTTTRMQTLRL